MTTLDIKLKPMCVCGEPMTPLHRLTHVVSYTFLPEVWNDSQNKVLSESKEVEK